MAGFIWRVGRIAKVYRAPCNRRFRADHGDQRHAIEEQHGLVAMAAIPGRCPLKLSSNYKCREIHVSESFIDGDPDV